MIPLYSTDHVRKADHYAVEKLNIPSIALMENASRSIFQIVLEKFPELNRNHLIGILCGSGNNGGDGFALARHLINNGFNVKVLVISKATNFSKDAKINFIILKELIRRTTGSSIVQYRSKRDLTKFRDCYIIFDALLGTGSKGELREPLRSIVSSVNDFDSYRIAIDVPTGLDLDSSSGDPIFNADLTITLAELKSGLFYGKGYVYSGEIEKGYIGIGDEYFSKLNVENYLIEPEDAFIGLPVKKLDVHKYSSGKVLTIAGSGSLPGAAFYTANSVINSGSGASILAFPKSIKLLAQSKLKSSVVAAYEDDSSEIFREQNIQELKDRLDWADCIAIGPGLGRDAKTVKALHVLLKKYSSKRIVIDADAIFALSNNEYKKFKLNYKVLTPHHGEFAQLLGIEIAELQNDILGYGKKFVKETGAYLALKGSPTMIFSPSGEALINTTGNPGMATFGSGDILTGIIASFISQNKIIEEAVVSAVYVHSLTADLLLQEVSEIGINADLIMNNIPHTIKFLEDSFAQIID